jgi:hypothetical protein
LDMPCLYHKMAEMQEVNVRRVEVNLLEWALDKMYNCGIVG